jgi:hypothetical protein
VELIEMGANRLAPPRSGAEIARAIDAALGSPPSVFERREVYGSGNAAEKIAARLTAAA